MDLLSIVAGIRGFFVGPSEEDYLARHSEYEMRLVVAGFEDTRHLGPLGRFFGRLDGVIPPKKEYDLAKKNLGSFDK